MRQGSRGVVAVVLAILGAAACATSASPTPVDRDAAARALLAGIHLQPSVTGAQLAATSAVADLGVQGGVHLVRVRILDQLQLQVLVEADQTVAFAEPPSLCLVGPFSAPDDAGLSDPCWGEPDLGALLSAQLATDASGHPSLAAGQPIDVAATRRTCCRTSRSTRPAIAASRPSSTKSRASRRCSLRDGG